MKKANLRTGPKFPNQQTRLAAAAVTSAVSLGILGGIQDAAQGQTPPPIPIPGQRPVARPAALPTDEAAFDKYFVQGYNYADALVLAAFWGENSPGEAKLRMGRKMLAFGPQEGDIHIREARGEALKKTIEEMPCWYSDGGYTYDDAELLGQYWGTGLVESKYTMTRLLAGGHDIVIQAALRSAKGGR